ncbi:MAG: UDP-N-acetylmuramate:L-alanyl-gamma-D-glutamyl-meso-diaminopimelate ligase [Pseudomonadota bacterium]
MHIHIIGVCGTFMGGVARLATELGHAVSGSDKAFYPPMSDQLAALGVTAFPQYTAANLSIAPDLVVIGNAVSRGNPEVEAVLDRGLPYTSGAQWLGDVLLRGRRVVAVAGTHGKTTTSSLVAHLLEAGGLAPGFLIGGVPGNFGVSARLGQSDVFVVEADEYDTAFFDKRSKFVHYRPRVAVLNNLEFDHADIFADLAAIETQFHHLLRCVPGQGSVVVNAEDTALARVLERGCWSNRVGFGAKACWHLDDAQALCGPGLVATQPDGWIAAGRHNRLNALAALAACAQFGLDPVELMPQLARFEPPKRRLERLGISRGVVVYDDFAHHPTAIAATLDALQSRHPGAPLRVALELRSNSMRAGAHADALPLALNAADQVVLYDPDGRAADLELGDSASKVTSLCELIDTLARASCEGDCIVCMSNGSFEGVQRQILDALAGP